MLRTKRLVAAASITSAATILAISTTTEEAESSERLTQAKRRLRSLSHQVEDALGFAAVTRFCRTFGNAAVVAYSYKSIRATEEEKEAEAYKAALSEVHLQAAQRLLRVCQLHGGVFVKFGQYVASLVRIIPEEYTETLRVLQDSNPGVPMEDIRQLFLEEFGAAPQEFFTIFAPTPIAAASLAQVHKAITKDGEVVAVKVQYPRLRAQIRSDIWTMRFLATVLGLLFKDYEYTWLFPDFEESMGLELDFLQEATNAERVARLFASDSRVYIPTIRWDLSTKRVLTMEFVEGTKVTKVKALKQQGINPLAVGNEISQLFSHMIFYHGFVHCDPHPGNLLIRKPPPPPAPRYWWETVFRSVGSLFKSPSNDFQVVLLDHGMYRRLNESFRRSYCNLWKAFMTRDDVLGRKATEELGLDGELFEVLSLISVNRTPQSSTRLGITMSKEERDKIRSKYKDRTKYGAKQLKELLSSLPRDVLFVFRTNSLVRSLNSELGSSLGTRFRIFGSSAVVGLSIPPATIPATGYFMEEERDYNQIVPASQGGPIRVLQKRLKREMLINPGAGVNTATASETFLFTPEQRPVLKEVKRRLQGMDLHLRLWLLDMAFNLWHIIRERVAIKPVEQLDGEKIAKDSLT